MSTHNSQLPEGLYHAPWYRLQLNIGILQQCFRRFSPCVFENQSHVSAEPCTATGEADRRLQTTVLIVVTHSTRRLTGPVEQVTSVLCPAVLNLFAARIRAGVHITTFSLTPPRTRTRCLLLRVSNAPRSWCQPRWCRPAFSCVMVLAAWRLSRDSCLPSAQTRPRRHAMPYAVSRSVPCADAAAPWTAE